MTQRSGWPVALALLVAGTVTSAGSALAQSKGPTSGDQASGYESTCAPCHGNPATRAPTRESLHAMSPDFIVSALTDGLMKDMGAGLSLQQRVALAEFLTDRKVGKQTPMAGHCVSPQPPLLASGAAFNGWGVTVANPRYQPEPGLSAADLPKLKMAWAFGVPGVVAMFGQPTIAGGRVFFGSQNGHVYSLDARTGCYYWDYQASAGVRTAITIARIGNRDVALFGDRRGHAYSVDAATGETVWKVTVVEGPHLGVTGAPTLFEGKLYVPINGGDDSAALDPKYECCKGRGEVAALDAESGKIIWQAYTIPDATPQGKNTVGTQLWGPSGASIWSSPTIDTKLGILYVGTGDNHSAPATDMSDAVLAIALDSGKILWAHQLLVGDMGNASCFSADKVNCPEPHGPDYDLGATGNLVTLPGGKRVLTIGQKSGMVWRSTPTTKGVSCGSGASARAVCSAACSGVRQATARSSTRPCRICGPSASSRLFSIPPRAVACTRSRPSPAPSYGPSRLPRDAIVARTAAQRSRPRLRPRRTSCSRGRSMVTCVAMPQPMAACCGTLIRSGRLRRQTVSLPAADRSMPPVPQSPAA